MRKSLTLIEILIVVAIIALLAVIAIPNLLRTRLTANEDAAQATLQNVSAAAQTFRSTNNNYPTTLAALEKPDSGPAYITLGLNDNNQKQGYIFTVVNSGDNNTFLMTAVPVVSGTTGSRSFCVTEDGVVRVDPDGGAIADYDACVALNSVQQ